MKKLLLITSLILAQSVKAADYEIKVCEIQSHTDGTSGLMKPCADSNGNFWTSKNGCPSPTWVRWEMNEGQGQAMYSTALAALMADKSIKVRLDGSSCNQYDEITMVRIIK